MKILNNILIFVFLILILVFLLPLYLIMLVGKIYSGKISMLEKDLWFINKILTNFENSLFDSFR